MKNILIALIFFTLLFSLTYAVDIGACAAISAEGNYDLNMSILGTVGNCFSITANNVTFNCNGYTIDGDDIGTDSAFTFTNKDNITISNCTLQDFARPIVALGQNVTIRNNTFLLEGAEYGIRHYGNNSLFVANNFSASSTTDAFYLYGYVANLSMANNSISGIDGWYSSNSSNYDTVFNTNFTGNNLSNLPNHGIDFNAYNYTNILIADNNFYYQNGGSFLGFIYIRKINANMVIRNNTFNSGRDAISAITAGGISYNLSVINNTFNDSDGVRYRAIRVYYVRSLNISQNRFYDDNPLPFITLQRSNETTLSHNVFGDAGDLINMTSTLSTNWLLLDADNMTNATVANNSAFCWLCSGYSFTSTLGNNRNITMRYNAHYSFYEPVRVYSIGDESATGFVSGTDCLVEYNNLTIVQNDTLGNACHAVFNGFVHNSTVRNNILQNATQGIVIKSAFNITIANNTVSGSEYNNYYDKGSTNCSFISNIASQPSAGSYAYAMRIADNPAVSSAIGSYWQDNIITYTSGVTNPFKVETLADVTVVNSTYNTTDEAVAGNFTRKWWHYSRVLAYGLPLNNQNVSVYNSTGSFITNETSTATGYTQNYALTEYRTVLGVRAYAGNYTLNATYLGVTLNDSKNITVNTYSTFSFGTVRYSPWVYEGTLNQISNIMSTSFYANVSAILFLNDTAYYTNLTGNNNSYFARLNLTTNEFYYYPNYTVYFNISTAGLISGNKLDSNCDYLKVFYGSKELDRYVVNCGYYNTTVYVRVQKELAPYSSDNNYYIRYNKTFSTVALKDYNNTFLLYDDFDSGINASKWNTTCTITATGLLNCSGTSGQIFRVNYTNYPLNASGTIFITNNLTSLVYWGGGGVFDTYDCANLIGWCNFTTGKCNNVTSSEFPYMSIISTRDSYSDALQTVCTSSQQNTYRTQTGITSNFSNLLNWASSIAHNLQMVGYSNRTRVSFWYEDLGVDRYYGYNSPYYTGQYNSPFIYGISDINGGGATVGEVIVYLQPPNEPHAYLSSSAVPYYQSYNFIVGSELTDLATDAEYYFNYSKIQLSVPINGTTQTIIFQVNYTYPNGTSWYSNTTSVYQDVYWSVIHELNTTINTPANTTYVNRSINASFTLYSPYYASAQCARYVNGTLLANTTVLNGSTTIDDTSAWDYFNHNQTYTYSVNCTNSSDGVVRYNETTQYFTTLHYNVTSLTYSSWVYEATNQTIVMNVTFADALFNKSAGMFWNNTNYSCVTSGDVLSCSFNPIAAIIAVNNTNLTITPYVSYSPDGIVAPTAYNQTALTQAVWYAYSLNSLTSDNSRYVEGATSTATLTINNLTNLAQVYAIIQHYYANGTDRQNNFTTANGSTALTELFTTAYNVGESAAIYEYQTWNASVTYSYLGGSRTEYATNLTINISQMILTDCGAGGYSTQPTINFFVLDEETGLYLENATVEIFANVLNGGITRNYSFTYNLTGTTNDTLCIYPEWGEFNTSAWFYYSATGYSTRSYYVYTALSNTSSDLYLYLLSSGSGALTIIYVIDESGLALEDYTVQVQRFYVGNGSYLAVAQVKTDFEGKGTTYLVPNDVYYRFIVLQNATVVKTVSATTIVCGSGTCPPYKITIQIMNSTIPYFLQSLGTISHGCVYNDTTTILSCTAIQTTQLAQNFNLRVSKYGLINNTYYCDDYCASTSCVMTCNLSAYGNLSTDYFYYSFFANYPDGTTQLLDTGQIGNYRFATDWGLFGILATLALVLILFFASAGNPAISMILSYGALILAYTIGLMPVSLGALTGLGLLVLFIVWKVRT